MVVECDGVWKRFDVVQKSESQQAMSFAGWADTHGRVTLDGQ